MSVEADNVPLALMAQQIEILAEQREYVATHRREFAPDWYDWQLDSFSAPEPQVACLAGNQTGKTLHAGFHFACDVTGNYPDWWQGFRFDHQLNTTVLGVDSEQLKEVIQQTLFGNLEPNSRNFTGGWIHPGEIEHIERSQISGIAKAVYVRSKFGTSKIALRTYSQIMQGQATLSFAGTVKDLIWADECPPDELVGQLIMRLANGNRGKGGRIRFTMTPELGQTNLVTQFMEECQPGLQRMIGPIDWDQCPHMTPDKQAALLSGIPEHEHEMRKSGMPFFGSGLIFPISDARIECDPFDISERPWMRLLRSVDLGIDHPTAGAWLAYDEEIDTMYLVNDYSQSGENAATHVAAMNSMWPTVPIVFPPDIEQREKGSGKTVRTYWEQNGIDPGLGLDFANPDGSRFVEPGLMMMLDRMRKGTFKVFRGRCPNFMREKRMYHRKNGKRVDTNNDVIDATRYGAMMLMEHGQTLSAGMYAGGRPNVIRARG